MSQGVPGEFAGPDRGRSVPQHVSLGGGPQSGSACEDKKEPRNFHGVPG